MKTNLSPFDRRMEIMFKILRHGKITVSELKNEYSVCANTIRNDIAFVGRYVPIYTKQGKYGGIFLEANYNRNVFKFYLSKDEEKVLEEVALSLSGRKAQLVRNIINKYAIPLIGT